MFLHGKISVSAPVGKSLAKKCFNFSLKRFKDARLKIIIIIIVMTSVGHLNGKVFFISSRDCLSTLCHAYSHLVIFSSRKRFVVQHELCGVGGSFPKCLSSEAFQKCAPKKRYLWLLYLTQTVHSNNKFSSFNQRIVYPSFFSTPLTFK